MNIKQKENAVFDFLSMIYKSWTWKRMTKEEQVICNRLFEEPHAKQAITGSYDTRYKICQAIYASYLAGLGYRDGFWREPKEKEPAEELHFLRNEFIRKQCNPYPFIGHSHY